MKGMLKWPLIIAAIFVVARVLTEQAGLPDPVSELLSVAVLYVLIFPLYFANRIAGSNVPHPYRTQLKVTGLYAALARSMVIPTYWLAYVFQWPQGRFSVGQGGVVGAGVAPLRAFVFIPLVAGLAWVLASVIIGGGLGSALIKLKRKSPVTVGV